MASPALQLGGSLYSTVAYEDLHEEHARSGMVLTKAALLLAVAASSGALFINVCR